jgi:hypothetical protein
MSVASESSPGWRFAVRWRYRLFRCHGCGIRMRKRTGVLTQTDSGKLQWGCLRCYHEAFRRAQT